MNVQHGVACRTLDASTPSRVDSAVHRACRIRVASYFPGGRRHQARPRALLRSDRRVDAAPPGRSAADAGPVPGRACRRRGARKGVDCFFMKHAKVWGPPAIRRVRIREKTKIGEYLIAERLPALVGLVQMNVLEVHTWNSRVRATSSSPTASSSISIPASASTGRASSRRRALVRELLRRWSSRLRRRPPAAAGCTSSCRSCRAPTGPRASSLRARSRRRWCGGGRISFTERFAKAGRDDKILIDYLRNNRTNTSIAAYSTRARPDAPVSMPMTWGELSRVGRPIASPSRRCRSASASCRRTRGKPTDERRSGFPRSASRARRWKLRCERACRATLGSTRAPRSLPRRVHATCRSSPADARRPFSEWLARRARRGAGRGIRQRSSTRRSAGVQEPLPVDARARPRAGRDGLLARALHRAAADAEADRNRARALRDARDAARRSRRASTACRRGSSRRSGAWSRTSAGSAASARRSPRWRRSRGIRAASTFFRGELFNALEILNRGDIDLAQHAKARGPARWASCSSCRRAI